MNRRPTSRLKLIVRGTLFRHNCPLMARAIAPMITRKLGNALVAANRVTGNPRPSTPEIGKLVVEMKVNNAVAQINRLIAAKASREE
jgi:creatinine amidohydrolase/Fe(II)-dependent formamide hydrolase-like protein